MIASNYRKFPEAMALQLDLVWELKEPAGMMMVATIESVMLHAISMRRKCQWRGEAMRPLLFTWPMLIEGAHPHWQHLGPYRGKKDLGKALASLERGLNYRD